MNDSKPRRKWMYLVTLVSAILLSSTALALQKAEESEPAGVMLSTDGSGLAAAGTAGWTQTKVDRGLELYRNKEFREAAEVLKQATAEAPREPTAWTYLGLARIELKEHEGAVAAFQEALKLDDKSAEAHYGLGLAQAYLGKIDRAIGELERAVDLNPKHAWAHYHLGLAYNKKGQTDRTILHLQRFLELEPEAPEAAQVKALLSRLR